MATSKGNAGGLAVLGLAVAGVMAWRNRDKLGQMAKDAQAKAGEMASDLKSSGDTAPNANDIPVSNAV